MAKIDKNYHNLLNKILTEGYYYEDPNRKGVQRLEIPSYTFRHEFSDGFPAIATKKLAFNSVITELIQFLRGDTNIKYLVDNNCNIWNKDAYNYYLKKCKNNEIQSLNFETFINEVKLSKYVPELPNYIFGDLGNVYGKYWRDFEGVDQIKDLIENLINNPLGTEHIITARNPADKNKQALPCCHFGLQVVVRPLSLKERLKIHSQGKPLGSMMYDDAFLDSYNIPKYGFELHWKQRSVDTFLGLPFNIASYATLALILEKITGYKALAIQGDLKKVHLYDNSLDAVKEQLSRDVNKYDKCELNIIPDIKNTEETINDLFELLEPYDFQLQNYESYPNIKVEMLERTENGQDNKSN